jgi:hypothetical protein
MSRTGLLRVFDAVLPASVVLPLAVAGTAASAVVAGSTLASDGPIISPVAAVPLFAGMFVVHARSVRTLLPERGRFKQRLLGVPRPILAPAVALAACAFVLGLHAVITSPGQPERHGDAYYVRNHTELTRVSRGEYRYAERLQERIFTAIPLVFYLLGILIHLPPTHSARVAR